jgi:hypothetical protein
MTAPKRQDVLTERNLNRALVAPNVKDITAEPLLTPVQQEQTHKARQVVVKRASLANKRKQSVAAASNANGVSALSAELQDNDGNEPITRPSTTLKQIATTMPTAVNTYKAPTPSTAPILTGPPAVKCQGCIHCDLLDLHCMAPTAIRHYIKPNEFLALARCAGDCAGSIKDIYTASIKKDSIHYCEMGKKGFDAPEEDASKASLECGLVLCLPCYGTRGERYALENNAQDGTTNQRSSRRRRINNRT